MHLASAITQVTKSWMANENKAYTAFIRKANSNKFVTVLGEHVDVSELGRLLQLILGCAVNCEEKQEYIQRIMGMEESVQHSVMRAIQEVCALNSVMAAVQDVELRFFKLCRSKHENNV